MKKPRATQVEAVKAAHSGRTARALITRSYNHASEIFIKWIECLPSYFLEWHSASLGASKPICVFVCALKSASGEPREHIPGTVYVDCLRGYFDQVERSRNLCGRISDGLCTLAGLLDHNVW
jgi:hypothetical protein